MHARMPAPPSLPKAPATGLSGLDVPPQARHLPAQGASAFDGSRTHRVTAIRTEAAAPG